MSACNNPGSNGGNVMANIKQYSVMLSILFDDHLFYSMIHSNPDSLWLFIHYSKINVFNLSIKWQWYKLINGSQSIRNIESSRNIEKNKAEILNDDIHYCPMCPSMSMCIIISSLNSFHSIQSLISCGSVFSPPHHSPGLSTEFILGIHWSCWSGSGGLGGWSCRR